MHLVRSLIRQLLHSFVSAIDAFIDPCLDAFAAFQWFDHWSIHCFIQSPKATGSGGGPPPILVKELMTWGARQTGRHMYLGCKVADTPWILCMWITSLLHAMLCCMSGDPRRSLSLISCHSISYCFLSGLRFPTTWFGGNGARSPNQMAKALSSNQMAKAVSSTYKWTKGLTRHMLRGDQVLLLLTAYYMLKEE